ncbi:MAG: hypothetical protein C4523_13025 [Myxococcales bacterium]|nr:MAG: hypothetical protein C4523_13025 [Myxococcales bacterium]
MENWQLTLVILASVFVGALIPLLIMIAITFYRTGREIVEVSARLRRTLTQVETVSDRLEVLSRGFKGGEKDIADLMASLGTLARGLEQNMKIINIFSAIMAAVGPVVAAFIKTRFPAEETGRPPEPDAATAPENGPPPFSSAASPGANMDAH